MHPYVSVGMTVFPRLAINCMNAFALTVTQRMAFLLLQTVERKGAR